MRIEEINISGFGLFNQANVKKLDPCLNIMLGENESGKSTCLEFVRTLLFGSVVGVGARKAPKYPAPSGSEPGGSLIIRTSDNQLLKRTWQPGAGLGKQGLWAINNGELEAKDLNEFSSLTGYISRELYAAVYGFSLDQLQELNSLKDDARVADILYGAGFGLGSVPLPQVLRDLEGKYTESLFKPKGSNQPINKIMARLKALRQEMKQYAEAMPKYNQIEQELAHLSEKLAKEQKELAQMRLFQGCLQDLLKLQLNLPKLQQMHLRLDELNPQTSWADEQIALLKEYDFTDIKNLALQTQKLQTELNDIGLEQATLGKTLGTGAEHALILESQAAIKSLVEEKARYQDWQQEFANINIILNNLFSKPQFISCFGDGFNDLPAEQQGLRLRAKLEEVQRTKDEFGQLQAQWQFLNNNYQSKSVSFAKEDSPLLEQEQNLASPQAKPEERLAENVGEKLKQKTAIKSGKLLGLDYRVVIILELLGFGGLFAWLYQKPDISPLWMAFELGVCILIVGGIGLKLYNKNRTRRANEQRLKEETESLEKGREVLLDKSREIAHQLLPLLVLIENSNPTSLSDNDLVALFEQYSEEHGKQIQATLEQWQQAVVKLARAQELAGQLSQLEQRGEHLYQQLLPDDANNAFGNGLADDQIGQITIPKSFLVIVNELDNRLNLARQAQLEQSKVNGQLASFSQQQLTKQTELTTAQNKLQTIYAQAKVRNLDDLQKMYQLWEEKSELNKSKDKLQNELLAEANDIFCKLSTNLPTNLFGKPTADLGVEGNGADSYFEQGLNHVHSFQNLFNNFLSADFFAETAQPLPKEAGNAEALLTLLQATPREKLVLEVERISKHMQSLEALLREEIKEQGALQQQALALMSEDSLTALGFEESALQEELSVLSRKWAVAALAKHFVLEAKTAFEQEHQTAVMSGASKYFKQITNGAYQGLDPSAEPGSFAVLTGEGESRMPEQLSRGTREQLYLALRVALIEDRAVSSALLKNEESGQELAYSEPLPLIMDDVLVNFDPVRTKRSIKSILALASRHQIFYFTCQPHMLPLLREQAEIGNCSYKCFNLAGGQIASF